MIAFWKDSSRKDGHHHVCKDCARHRRRLQYSKNPGKYKAYNLSRYHNGSVRKQVRSNFLVKTYGITLEKYKEMLESQDGNCAICGGLSTDGKSLNVDHCHKTGKVRGLLCRSCNNAIGMLGDDLNGLMRAVVYLSKYPEINQ